MECKNCKKYIEDCGYHYQDKDKHIDYEIPSEIYTDKAGSCKYYEENRDNFEIAWNYLQYRIDVGAFSYRQALAIKEKYNELLNDIETLLGKWFIALEDEGVEPWGVDDCVSMAEKYGYTKEDYFNFKRTIY